MWAVRCAFSASLRLRVSLYYEARNLRKNLW